MIFLILFYSCNTKVDEIPQKQNNINKPGIYSVGKNKLFIREFTDGTVFFGVVDSHSKILYQSNGFTPFSKYQKWGFYIDSEDNIWFYNDDYQEYAELIKDTTENKYKYKTTKKIDFPIEFKNLNN